MGKFVIKWSRQGSGCWQKNEVGEVGKRVAVGEGKGGDYKYTRLLNRKKWVPK